MPMPNLALGPGLKPSRVMLQTNSIRDGPFSFGWCITQTVKTEPNVAVLVSFENV